MFKVNLFFQFYREIYAWIGGKTSVKKEDSGMWDRFRWFRIGFILV